MRKTVFLLLLTAGLAQPMLAANPVSVAKLEQLLAQAHGQSDGKVAAELYNLQLTQRANSIRLARWQSQFPGRHCHEALTELADASAFLDLPAEDMPANAPPDQDAQKAILARTSQYVNTTISRLPNFYATRKTERFEDSPSHQTVEAPNSAFASSQSGRSGFSNGQSSDVPMHSIGTSNVSVTYRDGYELKGSKKLDFKVAGQNQAALETAGEFGPILSVVLDDASNGQIAWGHWEQSPVGIARSSQPDHGLAAVFRYSVAQQQSHYVVGIPHGGIIDQVHPAYHGEIAVDPETGEILRITVDSDLAPPNQVVKSSIAVEYGSISIGGTNYICPVKSVAISKTPVYAEQNGIRPGPIPVQTELNDVAFVDYHVFRSEARILIGDNPGNDQPPAPPK